MNQPTFVPSILSVKASEELLKSVSHDLQQTQEKSISELLNEEEEKNDQSQTKRDR